MAKFTENPYDPDEWEKFFISLLPFIHGFGNYERVDSVIGGDLGIDAFSSDGCLYQCYSDQGSLSHSDRYAKQRAKINEDLAKFCTKRTAVAALLNDQMIDRWILVMPMKGDKDLIKYCAKKTAEIRAMALPYVAPGFKVTVLDMRDLAAFETMAKQPVHFIIDAEEPSLDEAMAALEAEKVETLRLKLLRAYPKRKEAKINEALHQQVLNHAYSQNCLDELRDREPSSHRDIQSVVRARERRLVVLGASERENQSEVLREQVDDLLTDIIGAAPLLDAEQRQVIAIGAVADWMMRCPLDFS